jgi:hypothetical protein
LESLALLASLASSAAVASMATLDATAYASNVIAVSFRPVCIDFEIGTKPSQDYLFVRESWLLPVLMARLDSNSYQVSRFEQTYSIPATVTCYI